MSKLPYPKDTSQDDRDKYQQTPTPPFFFNQDTLDDTLDFSPSPSNPQQLRQDYSPYSQPQQPSSILDLPQSSRFDTNLNKYSKPTTLNTQQRQKQPKQSKQQQPTRYSPPRFQKHMYAREQYIESPYNTDSYKQRSLPQSPQSSQAQRSFSPGNTNHYVQYQQQYPYDSPVRKSESDTTDEYEMSTLINRELPPLPNEPSESNQNPFRDEYNIHSNGNESSPATTTNNSNPFSNHEKPNDDSSSEKEFETTEDRFKRNENNRIRTLRSKPRFHYTRLPYFTIVVTLIQVIIFIIELIRMRVLTGSAFQTQPYFNPMLGPSTFLLINMGARYVPCMHQILGVTDDTTILFPCANSTNVDTYVCNLAELCGLSDIPIKNNAFIPDQWYRIFIPIFLHAGFLHIIFNLLLQVTMGGSIERNIGILKYAIIYMSSGIAGFLLGANFTPQGIASTGASGALFGIVATNMILFVYTGKKNTNMYGTKHYTLFICIMIGEIVVSFVLGLLPGLDNFSHIGGFAMGILMAIVFLKDPYWVYVDGIIVFKTGRNSWQQFVDQWNPFYAIEDKLTTPFMVWMGARIIAFALAVVYFAVLMKNFFASEVDHGSNCTWCKYINCIPVHGWCDVGQVTVSQVAAATSTGDSAPTATQDPKTSMIEKTITTVITPDSEPTSIENHKRKININYESFKIQEPSSGTIDAGEGFIHQQAVGVGMGIYIIIGMFTIGFLKKKKVL